MEQFKIWTIQHPFAASLLLILICVSVFVGVLLYFARPTTDMYTDEEDSLDSVLAKTHPQPMLSMKLYAGFLGTCIISYYFTPGQPADSEYPQTCGEVEIISIRTTVGLSMSDNILQALSVKQLAILQHSVYNEHYKRQLTN